MFLYVAGVGSPILNERLYESKLDSFLLRRTTLSTLLKFRSFDVSSVS